MLYCTILIAFKTDVYQIEILTILSITILYSFIIVERLLELFYL